MVKTIFPAWERPFLRKKVHC